MSRSLMSRSFRAAVLAAIVGAMVVSATAAGGAGGAKILDDGLVGIPESAVKQVLQGVTGGGLPWRLDRGSVHLFADGRLQLSVQGLVLAAGGSAGTNPVPTARAIVTCAGAPAAMSSIVPYSPQGDAMIDETIDLPTGCLAPAVFFAGITGGGPRWFAVTGW